MKVLLANTQKDLPLTKCHDQITSLVEAILHLEKVHADEISIVFVNDKTMRKLHTDFFQDPSPTDCISFPIDVQDDIGYKILGEVVVCPKTAITYAKGHRKDPYQELTLYVVHGLLHLLGYDDTTPSAKLKMRKAEKRHMNNLRKKGLLIHNDT